MAAEQSTSRDHAARVAWELPEVVAYALLLILAFYMISSVVSAVLVETQTYAGGAPPGLLGNAFLRATSWAGPVGAPIYLLVPLVLAWWQIDLWTPEVDDVDPATMAHLRRAKVVVEVETVASLLCGLAGIFIIIGAWKVYAPSSGWSIFTEYIGSTLAAFVLAAVVFVGSRRILVSCRAAMRAALWVQELNGDTPAA